MKMEITDYHNAHIAKNGKDEKGNDNDKPIPTKVSVDLSPLKEQEIKVSGRWYSPWNRYPFYKYRIYLDTDFNGDDVYNKLDTNFYDNANTNDLIFYKGGDGI